MGKYIKKGAMGRKREKSNTICWNCANFVPSADGKYGCKWSSKFSPVEGWEINDALTDNVSFLSTAYTVVSCPEFVDYLLREKLTDPDIEGVEQLIAATVRIALQDYSTYWDKLQAAAEAHNRFDAEAAVKEIMEIEDWIKNCCDGLISNSISNEILKTIHADCHAFTEMDKDKMDLYKRIRQRINAVVIDLTKHNKLELKIANLRSRAEADMMRLTVNKPKELCRVCKSANICSKKSNSCMFVWVGDER